MNIQDIAELANVSVASVLRVLNNQPGVDPALRKKIKKVIKDNGYRRNLLARDLYQKKSFTIGLVLHVINTYFEYRINAITETCKQNNYRETGYSIPEDISIIGVDDMHFTKFLHPSLMTVSQDQYVIGKQAAELIIEYIEHNTRSSKKIVMNQVLTIRDSVRCLK